MIGIHTIYASSIANVLIGRWNVNEQKSRFTDIDSWKIVEYLLDQYLNDIVVQIYFISNHYKLTRTISFINTLDHEGNVLGKAPESASKCYQATINIGQPLTSNFNPCWSANYKVIHQNQVLLIQIFISMFLKNIMVCPLWPKPNQCKPAAGNGRSTNLTRK